MSIDNMKRISEVETEAVSIRRQAQTDARQIADLGKKQAEEMIESAMQAAREQYQKTIGEAEEQAAAMYESRLKEVAAECEAMKALAAGNLNKAVSVIMGKVVKSSDNG